MVRNPSSTSLTRADYYLLKDCSSEIMSMSFKKIRDDSQAKPPYSGNRSSIQDIKIFINTSIFNFSANINICPIDSDQYSYADL